METRFRPSRFPIPLLSGPERHRRIVAKTRHNLVTIALHLLLRFAVLTWLLAVALLPLSDYGRDGAPITYKAWVCNNPDCGFNIRIDNGEISFGRSVIHSHK